MDRPLLETQEDVASQVFSFLDGKSKLNLSKTCRVFRSNKLLLYDGPIPSATLLVSVLPEYMCHWGERSRNSFVFVTCVKPKTISEYWLKGLVTNKNVHAPEFICAWLHVTNWFHHLLDTLLREVAETLSPTVDEQSKKARFLLQTETPAQNTVVYVLKCACLVGNTSLALHILNNHVVPDGYSTAVMTALVSPEYSQADKTLFIRSLLSKSNKDVTTAFNYWSIKYALYSGDWDTFTVLYSHLAQNMCLSDIEQVEVEVCSILPESTQPSVYKDITTFRKSLLYPSI